MKKATNVLNVISKYILLLLVIVYTVFFATKQVKKEPNGFVELQMRYKHYIVSNKYEESEDTYVICLVNPVTGNEYKVYVADYLYMNVYFVGDTIK